MFRWLPDFSGDLISHLLRHVDIARRSSLGFYARFLRGIGQSFASRYLTWTTDVFQEADKRQAWIGRKMRPTESLLQELAQSELRGLDAQLFAELKVNLLSGLLVKMDMATMAASLEARSPFMDHELAEFVNTVPARYLLRRGRTKAVLRDAYADMLPREVIDGPKRGFEIPIAEWLQGELKPVLHDTVGSSDPRIGAYFDARFVKQLLNRSVLQDRNWGYMIYALLVLELWLRNAESETQVVRDKDDVNLAAALA
jgi:asparagine synthase (glutamine-hydrolysing)